MSFNTMLNEILQWFSGISISKLTNYYIFFLISLFILFSVWCFIPIIVRWIQIRFNILVLFFMGKKSRNSSKSRKKIQGRILKGTAWARQDFTWPQKRKMLWGDYKTRKISQFLRVFKD